MSKILLNILILLLFLSCDRQNLETNNTRTIKKQIIKKRVLYIDSYHRGYQWSDAITEGIFETFNAKLNADDSVDNIKSLVELKIFRMDTKRNQSEIFMKESALKAKKIIETWKPDLIIASNDNASKHLIEPYYKDADIPVVFCGINWSVEDYGYPFKNTTGMIEVSPLKKLIETLKKYAEGDSIGSLTSDVFSDRKWVENIEKTFKIDLDEKFAKNFEEWKKNFIALQNTNDIVIVAVAPSLPGWNENEAIKFIESNIKVPTGAVEDWMAPFSLITFAKIPKEQGEWSAKTALKILDGESPRSIPVTRNKKAKIILNMKLAKILNIKFPLELVQSSEIISAYSGKILFVNSYHKGYEWSDGIEAGLLKALSNHNKELFKIVRMNTKLNKSEEYKNNAATEVKKVIENWRPDIVIIADDNALKHLYVPYFKESKIPFVFCGANWDVTVYDLPQKNITGMIEIDPAIETIELLKKYANGERLGFIGYNSISEYKTQENYEKQLNIKYTDGKFVDDFDEWKREYLRLQNRVDIILWQNPIGIKGWNEKQAIDFIIKNTRIPTGTTVDGHVKYALLGRVKISEEQGWWAGNTALKILNGTSPEDIPLTKNKESKLIINMTLANELGIKFPIDLLKEASFVESKKE